MKCKYCGCEFEQSKRGRKKEYCNKEDCIRQARNEAQRKWYSKKMDVLKGTNSRIVEQEKKTVVYSAKDKTDTKIEMQDIGDIVQIARTLGTVRWQLIELLTKENEAQRKFDKQDQTFLHKLEFLEELTDEEAMKLIVDEKKSRELRRNTKNRRYLIIALLQAIKIKRPDAFVTQANKAKGDILKTIAKLKQDDNLYDTGVRICVNTTTQEQSKTEENKKVL